uniref:Predicted protein n=1 Tax=Hordeum vulgare subsp. vulgare TaxID=112509 RepID=F2D2Z8_HORVV|nr:predicted protein [Hordeum vulgare subsp. vulgare]
MRPRAWPTRPLPGRRRWRRRRRMSERNPSRQLTARNRRSNQSAHGLSTRHATKLPRCRSPPPGRRRRSRARAPPPPPPRRRTPPSRPSSAARW